MDAAAEAVRLKSLAYKVRDADPHRRVFCSSARGGHRYEFGAKLDEVEIAEFEARHGVRLPADYRGFIKHAGNGGAGPGYGVVPLRASKGTDPRGEFAVRSCPDPDTGGPAECGDPSSGCLLLCQHGCAYNSFLAVNGHRPGTVWSTDDTGCYFDSASFTAWYEQWADRAVRLLGRDRLLDGVRPGQPLGELVRVFGPVRRTWGDDPKRFGRYVSFDKLAATIRLGRGDVVAQVNRLFIA